MPSIERCHAVVRIGGDGAPLYGCELVPPHQGLAHLHIDEQLGRIEWCSHGEAKGVKR